MADVKLITRDRIYHIVQLPSGNYARVRLKILYTDLLGSTMGERYTILEAYEAKQNGKNIYYLPPQFEEPYGIDVLEEGEIEDRYHKYVNKLLEKEKNGELELLSETDVERAQKEQERQRLLKKREEASQWYDRNVMPHTPAYQQLQAVREAFQDLEHKSREKVLLEQKGFLKSGRPKPILKGELEKLKRSGERWRAIQREEKRLEQLVDSERYQWLKEQGLNPKF